MYLLNRGGTRPVPATGEAAHARAMRRWSNAAAALSGDLLRISPTGSLHRRMATVFAATTMVVAWGLTLAPVASATSSTCYASSCTGLDPAKTTCQYDA
ncbi:hypothetical protein ACF9IK_36175 [Kitasatospora hibisci]|uniref:hypothetical protein n=1 Tax=Kitasatospora hibisci TaxID=3369522 RepID=UPI003754CDF0